MDICAKIVTHIRYQYTGTVEYGKYVKDNITAPKILSNVFLNSPKVFNLLNYGAGEKIQYENRLKIHFNKIVKNT
jgi:hypothetical protein